MTVLLTGKLLCIDVVQVDSLVFREDDMIAVGKYRPCTNLVRCSRAVTLGTAWEFITPKWKKPLSIEKEYSFIEQFTTQITTWFHLNKTLSSARVVKNKTMATIRFTLLTRKVLFTVFTATFRRILNKSVISIQKRIPWIFVQFHPCSERPLLMQTCRIIKLYKNEYVQNT